MSQINESAPSGWRRVAQGLGFHVPMVGFALRTSLAAFAAVAIAYALGLEHPNWAAMSAWASSQPLREHLLSRSIYRFAGSVVGVVYAVALVLVAQDSLWILAFGVALWGTVCAYFGNLQRGFMVYGWMLAGYSASMVVLLHKGPAVMIWPLAVDRMLTVIVGVLVALCVGWFFAPRRKTQILIAQSRQAMAGVLQAVAQRLQTAAAPKAPQTAALLSQLAAVEELLELYPEGSRRARQTAQVVHWQQHCAMEVLYHLEQTSYSGPHTADAAHPQPVWHFTALEAQALALQLPPLVQQLQALAVALQQPAGGDVSGALRAAIAAAEAAVAQVLAAGLQVQPGMKALYQLLQAMEQGLDIEHFDLHRTSGAVKPRVAVPPMPLHRDAVGAKQAGVRAGGALLVFGVLWASTGSSLVSFGMLGLSVMLLVFSSFESPMRTMAFVLRGQLIGAALALLCQAWVWPHLTSEWQVVLSLLPFALLAGLVFAHKRTQAGAIDTNMAMFILLAPHYPDTVSLGQHASMALAVVCGPALAWLFYRWVYPTNAQQRMRHVAQAMLAKAPELAQRLLDAGPWEARTPEVWADGRWQAQLNHRMLRLVRWADKTQWSARGQLPSMALSLRAVLSALLQLQQWRSSTIAATPQLRRTSRLVALVLQRTSRWREADAAAQQRLQTAWQLLAQDRNIAPALAAQAQRIAQRDVPQLHALQQAFKL